MSTTATQTRTATTVLRDYELHHSGAHASPTAPQSGVAMVVNHPHWPTEHRRVPPYRPVNTQLDQSERRVYVNAIERTFIGTMFTGVFINATASKYWRWTLGRIDGGFSRYPVGGEF